MTNWYEWTVTMNLTGQFSVKQALTVTTAGSHSFLALNIVPINNLSLSKSRLLTSLYVLYKEPNSKYFRLYSHFVCLNFLSFAVR